MELEMECLTSRILLQKACSYRCQFCTKNMFTVKAGLLTLYDVWAKYKEKVPDVSDRNQNVETKCNYKLKFT